MNIKKTQTFKGLKILVCVSGSIAAVKTPLLVSELIKSGAEVRCVITQSASHLVSPLALSTLSRHRCYQDEDQWNKKEHKPLHIALSEWADIIVIAPLSASSLSRWVTGLGDNLLASILLASESPIIAAAAMNTGMWQNNAVIKNWETLDNYPKILKLSPSSGLLACDRIGEGRMVSNEIIALAIESALLARENQSNFKKDLTGLNFLITAGPTIESLDPARQLSNKSTGRMGVFIAQAAKFRGAHVDLIHGDLTIPCSLLEGLNTIHISNGLEMQKTLEKLQPSADVIIMAAAVSDLRHKTTVSRRKLTKENLIKSFKNNLEIVPDLLTEVNARKKKNQFSLGFSALTGNDEELKTIGEEKRINKSCDLLMANPIDRLNQGFGDNPNGGFLLGPNQMVIKMEMSSKFELANKLLDEIFKFRSKILQV